MKTLKRTERGWAGHFICSHDCTFRRNTLLEYGDIKIVVSTVGNLVPKLSTREAETIGYNRYFETMAFHAKQDKQGYWDANVSMQIDFNSEWAISEPWQEDKANEMHENVVTEIAGKLIDGVEFKIEKLEY